MSATAGRPAVYAVACAGDPLDRGRHSGIPFALLGALEELGLRTVPVRTAPSEPVVSAVARLRPGTRNDAYLSPSVARMRAVASGLKLVRRSAVAGCIQWGAGEFLPPARVPHVLLHDQTLLQASAYPWSFFEGVRPATLGAAIARDREMHRRVRAVCAFTHWAARSAVEDYGVPAGRVHVVGLGRNYDVPPPAHRDWRTPRFLFVGFDWERKGGPLLLRAFARVRARVPDATLTVVGGHPPLDAPGVTGLG
ncbi:MAG TPA: hypothetical protein VN238_13875, partial [Solirubrobacteraceae bacterium]|nr:hypothetical protein [Solirubrobacteraceae bacterium]